jgi:TRAP-type C4-dicarboxylate transport system permease large subunit
LANAVFGAMSGSSVAATALFGKTCYPDMKRLGYSDKLSLGTLASGATLAVLIPPSLILIVYGGWENVSVSRLFAAGIIPGILQTVLFMATIVTQNHRAQGCFALCGPHLFNLGCDFRRGHDAYRGGGHGRNSEYFTCPGL